MSILGEKSEEKVYELQKMLSNKDLTILTIEIGHLNESQQRMENLFKEFLISNRQETRMSDEKHTRNHEKLEGLIKESISSLNNEIKDLDEKHSVNYKAMKDEYDKQEKKNLAFQTKFTIYLAVGSVVAAGIWQFFLSTFKK